MRAIRARQWALRRCTAALGVGIAIGLLAPAIASATTTSYTTPGSYEFTVPGGVTSLTVTATGGTGGSCGSASGGTGSAISGSLPVNPGELLLIGVGGAGGSCDLASGAIGVGGVGGGGAGGSGGGGLGGAGGGGESVVSTLGPGPQFSPTALIVAGGGGGGGAGGAVNFGGNGGAVGATGNAGSGEAAARGGGGQPGTTSTGPGLGGVGGDGANQGGTGAVDQGGDGGSTLEGCGGGGGGGGYLGGGGGGAAGLIQAACGAGGGGGGASYLAPGVALDPVGLPGPAAITVSHASPAAMVAPAMLAFGTQATSTLSAPQAVTVTNSGGASLRVTGLSFTGADPGDFLVGSSTCGGAVAPGGSCQAEVYFAPEGQGSRSATLQVTSNDPASPATIAVSGTGGPALPGSQGPQGATGAQGPAGPQGPAAPAGKIVCQNTAVAKALCALEFAPGTFTSAGTLAASYDIDRNGRVIASGSFVIHHGRLTRSPILRLRPGRYTLVVTSLRGRHPRTLLRESIEVR